MLFFPASSALCSDEQRVECRICGMWIDLYLHTRHDLVDINGKHVMFCSLTCAGRYLNAHGREVKQVLVADYLTTELIDTANAVYLIGSDAPPVMSNTSIIAFSSREQARSFQKIHGGRIVDFTEALMVE